MTTILGEATKEGKREWRNMQRRYRARVKRGSAFLDEHKPGWANEIDTSKFNITDPYNCILGQLFMKENGLESRWEGSGYTLGSDFFNLREEDEKLHKGEKYAHHLGFTIALDETQISLWISPHHWDMLARFWISEIRARQAA